MALRLCSYNIEWFDDLFTKSNTLKTDAESRARQQAIRDVLQTVGADLIGIVEAPNTTTTTGSQSTVESLENFAQWAQLRTTKVLTGFISGGRQELALLYDPTNSARSMHPAAIRLVRATPALTGSSCTTPMMTGLKRSTNSTGRRSRQESRSREPTGAFTSSSHIRSPRGSSAPWISCAGSAKISGTAANSTLSAHGSGAVWMNGSIKAGRSS